MADKAFGAAATFFAVASKESAVTLPFFIATLALIGPADRRAPWAASLVSCGALLIYLGFRFAVLGTITGPDVTSTADRRFHADGCTRHGSTSEKA